MPASHVYKRHPYRVSKLLGKKWAWYYVAQQRLCSLANVLVVYILLFDATFNKVDFDFPKSENEVGRKISKKRKMIIKFVVTFV
jgi:hypothetical protein